MTKDHPVRNKTPVWVVDDEADFGESLVDLLHLEGWQARAYTSAEAFLQAEADLRPGILILDFFLPGLTALDLLDRVKTLQVDIAVVLVSAGREVPNIVAGIRAGALDFLPKPLEIDAVRTALVKCQDYLADREEARQRIKDARLRLARLTSREAEVLELMVQGFQNKEIAWRLNISQRTTETHRARVMAKMEARNLAQLFQLMTHARFGGEAAPGESAFAPADAADVCVSS